MGYYLVRNHVSHPWERSQQIGTQLLDAFLRAILAEVVPDDIETLLQRQLPDVNLVGGRPAIEVLSDGYMDQADRRLVGRLLVCPSR